MAGCIISIVLIYLSVRNINFRQSFDLIKNANLYLIAMALVVFVFSYVVRTIRWHFLLLPLKKLHPMRSFYFLIFGFFMNNILPLRLGEFVRAKVAGERFQISRSGVFATVVVERLMDIIVFIICFFLIACFVDIPVWLKNSFLLCTVIFGSMLVVLFLMSKSNDKFLTVINKLHLPVKISEILKSLFVKFATGLKFFQNFRLVLYVFITSLIVWFVEAYSYQLFFSAFGVQVSLMESIFVIIVIGMGVIIPTAPGFIGAIEFMGIIALGIFGVEKSTAFACIASLHFADMMAIYLLGIIGIIKEKLSFIDLFKFATIEDNSEVDKRNEK
ncbi:MAG: lysylphosphatidylglycerol synthase transmembrane domain-containing protein [Endomicrobiaceae bacterium]|nr:lysylphosphatidylglycerol synthase transmembrane domain-containing protein [Endomicrobiaceae bacterium]